MKNLIQKMQKGLAKMLGLPTRQEIESLKSEVFEMNTKYTYALELMTRLGRDMSTLREDMKTLYKGLESDIRNVKMNVKTIKPILKVEDPEAVAFIKGILSKHDHSIATQQNFLEGKMHELRKVEGTIRQSAQDATQAVDIATKASVKINNVLNGLGLTDKDSVKNEEIFAKVREVIKAAAVERA